MKKIVIACAIIAMSSGANAFTMCAKNLNSYRLWACSNSGTTAIHNGGDYCWCFSGGWVLRASCGGSCATHCALTCAGNGSTNSFCSG